MCAIVLILCVLGIYTSQAAKTTRRTRSAPWQNQTTPDRGTGGEVVRHLYRTVKQQKTRRSEDRLVLGGATREPIC